MAGVSVAVVVLIGVALVSRFYGWPVRDHLMIAGGSTAAGFLVGLIGYKRLVRTNRRATRYERGEIDRERSGP